MNFFDLHCDTATEAMKIHAGLYGSGLQLDLDRWQGGSLCQSYAVFIPDTLRGEPAWQYFVRCSTYWKEKIAETGKMTLLDHLAEAESCWKKGGNACFLAVEGGAVLAGPAGACAGPCRTRGTDVDSDLERGKRAGRRCRCYWWVKALWPGSPAGAGALRYCGRCIPPQ